MPAERDGIGATCCVPAAACPISAVAVGPRYRQGVAAPILVVAGPSGAGKTTAGRIFAAARDPSVHVEIDNFMSFVVRGGVEPWRPESAHQNEVLGGAVAAAAMRFAEGGYTVVVDGHIFPERLGGLAQACLARGVPIHYAVLRADPSTCLERVKRRRGGHPEGLDGFARLHDRYTNLGDHESSVIDASGPRAEVGEVLLAAFTAGRLVELELIGGVEKREIELGEHDAAWEARFQWERRRILDALGDGIRVEHIGSTAVRDLVAKPIVDIQVSVDDVRDEASYVPSLVAAGYELRVRERGHRMLRTPQRDVHLHVCDAGSDWERRHLAFRDRLRSSRVDRDRYAAVKRSLAARQWPSMNAYAEAKSDVIAEILGSAPR